MNNRELVEGVRKRVESTWVYGRDGYVESVGGQLRQAALDARALCDALEASERERLRGSYAELEAAAGALVYELGDYYFQTGDSELEALNRVRTELGLEPQKPKHQRVEE